MVDTSIPLREWQVYPARAAGNIQQVVGQLVEDKEDGNGDDHKSMSSRVQGNPSKRDGECACDKSGQGKQKKWRIPSLDMPVLAHDGQGIATEAIKVGVPQVNVACVSSKDIQSHPYPFN